VLADGAVTGKGLSDLIREEFGFRVTFFLMAAILVVNLGNVMAEFTGVFWASETFGVSRFISVPLAGLLVWAIVVAGTAKWVERIFLSICVVYLSYVVSAFFAKPEWLIALLHLLPPQLMHYIPTVRRSCKSPLQRRLRDHPCRISGNHHRTMATLLPASGRG